MYFSYQFTVCPVKLENPSKLARLLIHCVKCRYLKSSQSLYQIACQEPTETKEYIRERILDYWCKLASENKLDMMKFVHQTFKLTKEDVLYDNNRVLFEAGATDNVELVEWLVTEFDLNLFDFLGDNFKLLRHYKYKRAVNVLEFLGNTYSQKF